MTQALQVKQVKFNDDELLGIQYENQIYTVVRRVCECIGLSDDQTKRQVKNIQSDLVLSKGVSNLTLPTKGGSQATYCILIDFLPLWLAKISITPKMQENNPELVRKLIAYQLKAKDVLAAAFLPQHTTYPHLDQSVYHLQQSMQNTIDCVWQQGLQLTNHEARLEVLEQSKQHPDYAHLTQEYFKLCHMGTDEFRRWAKESVVAISSREGVHTNSVYRSIYRQLDKSGDLKMWRLALKTNEDCLYYHIKDNNNYIRGAKAIYNIFDAITKGHITWGYMELRNKFAKIILDRLIG